MDNLRSFFFQKRQQMHFNRSMKIKGRPWPQIIFFLNCECYLVNNTTLSILESSKFALRLPLYKL